MSCTTTLAAAFDGGDWEAGVLAEKYDSIPIVITCNKDATIKVEYVCPDLVEHLCRIDTGGITHTLGIADNAQSQTPHWSGWTSPLPAGTTTLFVVDLMMGNPPTTGYYTGAGVIKTTFQ
ncbi:hypothetical protein ID80_004643 [Salmonella enterica subsp. enterica serovar Ball]|nr:hypothetical protein [Salmonella enterica subsp. enterica serovar Ball]